jgi:hypothetical protein
MTMNHRHDRQANPFKRSVNALAPLGERLGEGVMQEMTFAVHPLT